MTRERINFEVALLASVLLHVMTVAGFQHREVLTRMTVHTPLARLISAWEAHHPTAGTPVVPEPEMQTLTFIETPRTFMETTVNQVTGEKPSDARYYSDKTTVAANRENPTGKTGDTPYLSGSETRMSSAANATLSAGAGGLPAPPPTPFAAAQIQNGGTPPTPTGPVLPQPTAEMGLKAAEENKLATPAQTANALSFESSPVPAVPTRSTAAPAVPLPSQPPATTGTSSDHKIATVKSRLTASGVSKIGVDAFNVETSPFANTTRR